MKKISFPLIIILVSMLIFACKNKEGQKKEEKFMVANPLLLDTTYTTEYVADVEAIQNVEVRSRIKGYVEKLLVDEGQRVKQGQLLFLISSIEFRQAVQKAKSTLKSAIAELKSVEIELENTKKLSDKNIIAKTELEMMKAKVDAMKAKVEEAEADQAQAQLNLSFTQIKAPFDGIINRIPNKIGALVEDGTLLTSISNTDDMFVYFNVSETGYLNYIANKSDNSKEVNLLLLNNEMYSHKGSIETIEGEFNESTGNIAFRAKFPNPDKLLKHGGSGKILVQNKLRKAIIIAQKSTFEIQDNVYVFLVDSNNTIKMQRILPKLRLQNLYVIESGIKATDKILVEGIQLVKEGDKISPQNVSPREAIKAITTSLK